jgi:hypothetical protein
MMMAVVRLRCHHGMTDAERDMPRPKAPRAEACVAGGFSWSRVCRYCEVCKDNEKTGGDGRRAPR